MKIYLSPSSQEHNSGVVAGYIEETVCNQMADAAQAVFLANGHEVKRNNPANAYYIHTQESNAWGADIHVCIHTNANSGRDRGARVGCINSADKTLKSTKLAQFVFNRISPITPAGDYLVTYTFNEVTKTNAICVYVEVSFHDNLADCQWILSNKATIGKTIAMGVLDYIQTVTGKAPVDTDVSKVHIQELGWINGGTSVIGTTGKGLRMEALRLNLGVSGVEYRVHAQDIGWMGWVSGGEVAGTTGQARRLEAIQIRLTGEAALKYDVKYRAHVQNIGWMDYVQNGETAGTTGRSLRMEAISVMLVPK